MKQPYAGPLKALPTASLAVPDRRVPMSDPKDTPMKKALRERMTKRGKK